MRVIKHGSTLYAVLVVEYGHHKHIRLIDVLGGSKTVTATLYDEDTKVEDNEVVLVPNSTEELLILKNVVSFTGKLISVAGIECHVATLNPVSKWSSHNFKQTDMFEAVHLDEL